MKLMLYAIAASTLPAVLAAATKAAESEYGPPRSPVSWQAVDPAKTGTSGDFLPCPSVLGMSASPSVEEVDLEDQRPFGEEAKRTVWLARFESVPIQGPEDRSALVSLSLAFDVKTRRLLSAFTNPARQWAKPAQGITVSSVENYWNTSPAPFQEYRSSVKDVLEVLWKSWGVDPNRTGQIVIRPRVWATRAFKFDINENPLPRDPPVNAWIIEVLGAAITEHRVGNNDILLTTRIVALRDGDLQFLADMILP